MVRRFLISRGGANEEVLFDSIFEKGQVALDFFRRVGDPVYDDVKLQTAQSSANLFGLVNVSNQAVTIGRRKAAQSAIEQIEVKTFRYRLLASGRADRASAAYKEHFHSEIT